MGLGWQQRGRTAADTRHARVDGGAFMGRVDAGVTRGEWRPPWPRKASGDDPIEKRRTTPCPVVAALTCVCSTVRTSAAENTASTSTDGPLACPQPQWHIHSTPSEGPDVCLSVCFSGCAPPPSFILVITTTTHRERLRCQSAGSEHGPGNEGPSHRPCHLAAGIAQGGHGPELAHHQLAGNIRVHAHTQGGGTR